MATSLPSQPLCAFETNSRSEPPARRSVLPNLSPPSSRRGMVSTAGSPCSLLQAHALATLASTTVWATLRSFWAGLRYGWAHTSMIVRTFADRLATPSLKVHTGSGAETHQQIQMSAVLSLFAKVGTCTWRRSKCILLLRTRHRCQRRRVHLFHPQLRLHPLCHRLLDRGLL